MRRTAGRARALVAAGTVVLLTAMGAGAAHAAEPAQPPAAQAATSSSDTSNGTTFWEVAGIGGIALFFVGATRLRLRGPAPRKPEAPVAEPLPDGQFLGT